eukprot:6211987-Pleurochrysis_carterae.AAC.5
MAALVCNDALVACKLFELGPPCLPCGKLDHYEKIALVVRIDRELDRLVAAFVTCNIVRQE